MLYVCVKLFRYPSNDSGKRKNWIFWPNRIWGRAQQRNAFCAMMIIVHKIERRALTLFSVRSLLIFFVRFLCLIELDLLFIPQRLHNFHPITRIIIVSYCWQRQRKKIDRKIERESRWVPAVSIICVGFLIISRRVLNRAAGTSYTLPSHMRSPRIVYVAFTCRCSHC